MTNTINICYATNELYAEPMIVSMYSMLQNADANRQYDISVMHKDLQPETMERVKLLERMRPGITIHMMDVSAYDAQVCDRTCGYITSETNYRLFLLGDLFCKYDRMIYLDCDTIVCGDISELFDTDLQGQSVGVVEAMDHRYLSVMKKAKFFEGKPYNIDAYKTKILQMQPTDIYFNAGVILFDLTGCRRIGDDKAAVRLLNQRHYYYNDQDVLNMMFHAHTHMLDLSWNYTNEIEEYHKFQEAALIQAYHDTYVSQYRVIHFVSGRKPWNAKTHLDAYYHQYACQYRQFIRGI